jgi:hypothetical protein
MLTLQQTCEFCTVRTGTIELTFRFETDRWGHEIDLLVGATRHRLLTSREGLPDDPVPPSPPFQELRVERPGEGLCEIQLFGRAGDGAYSAAVRFDAAAGVIDFDVCARRNRPAAAVCVMSRYAVDLAALPRGDSTLSGCQIGLPFGIDLNPVPIDGFPATTCGPVTGAPFGEIGAGYLFNEGSDRLADLQTIRWRYRMGVARQP